MSDRSPLDLLALFPAFDGGGFGGLQTSGREAWQCIASRPGLCAEAFQYIPGTSKLKALTRAASMRRSVETTLVWHLDLLKLAPVISSSRKRTVIFLHGIEAWRELDSLTTGLMQKADLFLSNSEHTWSRFLRYHPACASVPHVAVHLGLGEPLDSPAPPPDPIPAALMVGRIDEDYKGHRELIAIWPRVLSRLPEAELWIAGDGHLRPGLETFARQLGVTGKVIFFGSVPDSKKDDLLRRSRALFMPSGAEGFGLVYAEAMRVSRPCLVGTKDAGEEVVNPPEAGLAVDVADSDRLLDCVLRLLSRSAEWEQLAARARLRYENNFTARHFRERLLAALFEPGAGAPR